MRSASGPVCRISFCTGPSMFKLLCRRGWPPPRTGLISMCDFIGAEWSYVAPPTFLSKDLRDVIREHSAVALVLLTNTSLKDNILRASLKNSEVHELESDASVGQRPVNGHPSCLSQQPG